MTNEPEPTDEFMGEVKSRAGVGQAKVSYEVRDKDGNLKAKRTDTVDMKTRKVIKSEDHLNG